MGPACQCAQSVLLEAGEGFSAMALHMPQAAVVLVEHHAGGAEGWACAQGGGAARARSGLVGVDRAHGAAASLSRTTGVLCTAGRADGLQCDAQGMQTNYLKDVPALPGCPRITGLTGRRADVMLLSKVWQHDIAGDCTHTHTHRCM